MKEKARLEIKGSPETRAGGGVSRLLCPHQSRSTPGSQAPDRQASAQGGKPSTANGVANNTDLEIESSLRSYLFIQKRVISKRLLTTRKMRLAPTGAIYFGTVTSEKNEDFQDLRRKDIVKCALLN